MIDYYGNNDNWCLKHESLQIVMFRKNDFQSHTNPMGMNVKVWFFMLLVFCVNRVWFEKWQGNNHTIIWKKHVLLQSYDKVISREKNREGNSLSRWL